MIFTCQSLPQHWVVFHGGEYHIVPAVYHGWMVRRPFKGYVNELESAKDELKIGLGIP